MGATKDLLIARVVAIGVPKCSALHIQSKGLHFEGRFVTGITSGALLRGFEGKCFPSGSGKTLPLEEGQFFRSPGDNNDAQTVIRMSPRMTVSETTGPTSIQCAASILTAAKASTAARP